MADLDLEEYKLNTEYKRIHDVIHGYIVISNLASSIIDSAEFQRLRKLKQLGTCYFVFPNGIHDRFIHSIGTYHLAGRLMQTIVKRTKPSEIQDYLKSIPELSDYYKRKYNGDIYVLDDYICELVKIAGLCHDLGHGPFSHVFDDAFLPYVKNKLESYDYHEVRSCMLLDIIIKKDPILSKVILDPEIEFIKSLINPDKTKTGFLYQIVSNNLNGLDVDKFDYIIRDSQCLGIKQGFDFSRLVDDVYIVENTICYYPDHILYEVKRMYDSRYSLHKQVYCHKSVISSQIMITEIFKLLDPILNISKSVEDMSLFIKMTDEYILNSINLLLDFGTEHTNKYLDNIKKANELNLRLNKHDLYKLVYSDIFQSKKKLILKDFEDTKELTQYQIDNIIIFDSKIGYVSGSKKNPMDNLYSFGPNKDCPEHERKLVKFDKKKISLLNSDIHQEYIIMIFYKDSHDNKSIEKIRDLCIKLLN
jgi:HD superfamily phosphohydrolase